MKVNDFNPDLLATEGLPIASTTCGGGDDGGGEDNNGTDGDNEETVEVPYNPEATDPYGDTYNMDTELGYTPDAPPDTDFTPDPSPYGGEESTYGTESPYFQP